MVYKLKQKQSKARREKHQKKGLIAMILISAVLITSSTLYYVKRHNKPTSTPSNPAETINYTPTSPVEQKETDEHKDSIVKDQDVQSQIPKPLTSSGKKSVTPTITNADTRRISSYIVGIFEEEGTCTATFTKGSTTKTKTSSGFGNVSYTQCAPIDIEDNFLTSGTWQVKVSYSSVRSEGVSTTKQVIVP